MSKVTRKASELAIITVGELISELCRWPDHAAVTFRCPVQKQDLRFFRIEDSTKGIVRIELDPAPESVPLEQSASIIPAAERWDKRRR
jgi:hypothetical protein